MTGTRPVPVPDELSEPFWTGTARGELRVARCTACTAFVHPPAAVCSCCGNAAPLAFGPVTKRGVVRSWTVVRQGFLPGFEDLVPYVLVDVELEGAPGVRLIGRLIDGLGALPLGLESVVAVDFEMLGDGSAVPAFTLDEAT